MNILNVHTNIINDYATYTSSFIDIADEHIRKSVEAELADKRYWPDPLLQFNPAYQKAGRVDDLVQQGVLHQAVSTIFRGYELYKHQVDAIRLGLQKRDFVVTSGTGSGKSLTYIGTIFNHVLNTPHAQGVTAVIVYPMNALINSQTEEFNKYKQNYEQHTGRQFPIQFGQYTGQETESKRDEMRRNPPHILLTNYMMLELIMTRKIDSPIRDSINPNLQFLVFDEMHTYRGRQGADVAMLIRRIRANVPHDVTCIGTSATMVSADNEQTQKHAVAQVAQLLFGKPFTSEQVVNESLERSLTRPDFTFEELRKSLHAPINPDASAEELAAHPLANWLENSIALNQQDTVLRRRKPMPIREVARRIKSLDDISEDNALQCLNNMLAWISNVNASLYQKGARYTYLPYRIHQFFAQTGSVYISLEPADRRFVTLESARYRSDSSDKIPLFPVFFSRTTGEAFVGVHLNGRTLEPRDLRETKLISDDEGDSITDPNGGYIVLNIENWNPESDIDNLPETWFQQKKSMRVLKPNFQKRMPRRIWFNTFGQYSESPNTEMPFSGWFMPAPLLFDPSSGQIYDSASIRENSKLSELGGGGRSTATTITTLSVLNQLKESGFSLRDQKILSFTDNRQDAALQAGHFNDFVQVVQLRAALYQAIISDPKQQLTTANIGDAVSKALNLPQTVYTDGTHVGPALKNAKEQLTRMITYRLLEDAVRSWKVVLPNLEQCALVEYTYDSLDEVINDISFWNDIEYLNQLNPAQRHDFIRTILDFFRFEYAITDQYWFANLDTRERELRSGLKSPWRLENDDKLLRPTIIRLEPVNPTHRDMTTQSAGYMSSLGKYVRNFLSIHLGEVVNLNNQTYTPFMYRLFDKLRSAGYLHPFQLQTAHGAVDGYALNISTLAWSLGDEQHVRADVVRQRSFRARILKPNRYFQRLYKTPFTSHKIYTAADHTGQLTNDQRQEREERFRAEWKLAGGEPDIAQIRQNSISALYCSPTMELGVDIGGLTVVHMRNAPPNPANYAQRAGRAGRSGQGALVFTYCSSSPHDQHYFKHQADMVAGAVSAPQIELVNEDLFRTHLHAVVLGKLGMPSDTNSLGDYVDVQQSSIPLQQFVVEHLRLNAAQKGDITATFQRVIADLQSRLESTSTFWFTNEWIHNNLNAMTSRLDSAFGRWRMLYIAAQRQLAKATNDINTKQLNPSSSEYRKILRDQTEALSQISALLNKETGNTSLSEFYPYRYFAAEGFLPGYNFTKLPVRVFIPSQGEFQGDYISRPRSIALSEFGPENVIYYNANKYRVKQIVSMNSIDSNVVQAKASMHSGYLFMGAELQSDVCPITGHPLATNNDTKSFRHLIEMNECRARAIERITCDEEYRLREGYHVETYFNVPGGLERIQTAKIFSGSHHLMNLRYFPAASIHHINTGWVAEGNNRNGFPVHTQSGFWSKRSKLDDATQPDRTYLSVMPWTSVTADALYLEPLRALALTREQTITLQYAIKRGIELYFQVEPNEIGVTLVGHKDNPSMFIYESAEGSLGIMARFFHDPHTLNYIVERAIEICRYDDTTYRAPASYDDLLSYYNQSDHAVINRFDIRDALEQLKVCSVEIEARRDVDYDEHYQTLLRTYDKQSHLELRFLEFLYAHNLRLPDAAQKAVADAYIRPDFYYNNRIWVFCDGTPHDDPHVQERDEQVRSFLRDRGDQVLILHYRDSMEAFIAKRPDIFHKIR
jgi:superfamily II DNA/RNA helicase